MEGAAMRVLLVEDQTTLAEAVMQILKKNNYTVDRASDGQYGLECALTGIYDIVLLDIMMPVKDGLTVLKEMREAGLTVPVILLTARNALEDRVGGLNLGADDYLPKPFHTSELLARMKALLRRKPVLDVDDSVGLGATRLNPHTLLLGCREQEAKLSLKESQLLDLLLCNANRILSKNSIIEKIWGLEDYAEENRVETYISLLRKKLEQIAADIEIKTVRGAGYILQEKKDR
jgi:DNA-binding response OmpR family regulator